MGQSETEKRLEEAVDASVRAEGWTGIITGCVVLVAFADMDAEGKDSSGVATIYPQGSLPWPMTLGLLRACTLILEDEFRNL